MVRHTELLRGLRFSTTQKIALIAQIDLIPHQNNLPGAQILLTRLTAAQTTFSLLSVVLFERACVRFERFERLSERAIGRILR
jgi:hypothetical protein